MTTLRKLIYTAALVLSTMSFMPSLASAQGTVHGRFALKREVYWQNAAIPAGEYSFSVDENSSLLILSKLSGPPAGYLLMVPIKDESKASDTNRILLETSASGSYVSAMQLPQSEVTLRFDVPSMPEKRIARAETPTTGPGQ